MDEINEIFTQYIHLWKRRFKRNWSKYFVIKIKQ